jgi:hypothetical protein
MVELSESLQRMMALTELQHQQMMALSEFATADGGAQ